MSEAPASYLNSKRIPIGEAMALEGELPMVEALKRLEEKGYFTPNPRPWQIAFRDRGHGHGDYLVIDAFGDIVADHLTRENAIFIVEGAHAMTEREAWRANFGWEHDEAGAGGSVVECRPVKEHTPGFDTKTCLRCRIEAKVKEMLAAKGVTTLG